MTKDETVVLGAVLPELLLELGGCLGLDVAYRRSKAVSHSHQTLVGTPIPGLVADRPRGQKCDPEGLVCSVFRSGTRRIGTRLITPRIARCEEKQGAAEQECRATCVESCGKFLFMVH